MKTFKKIFDKLCDRKLNKKINEETKTLKFSVTISEAPDGHLFVSFAPTKTDSEKKLVTVGDIKKLEDIGNIVNDGIKQYVKEYKKDVQ